MTRLLRVASHFYSLKLKPLCYSAGQALIKDGMISAVRKGWTGKEEDAFYATF
ncbi:hypothetical protein M2C54_004812 [Escherichia coli]|nr:hypothetical protein [Escherichia coli]